MTSNRLGLGMLTVETAIFHWLYFDMYYIWLLLSSSGDELFSLYLVEYCLESQWKSTLKHRSTRISLEQEQAV